MLRLSVLLISNAIVTPVLGSVENTIYEHINQLLPSVQRDLHRVYVPNARDNTVSVIDATTYQVIDTFKTPDDPQHIVPAYDLKTLWVLCDGGNSVIPIDSKTGKVGKHKKLENPYNLYFTLDGQFAIVLNDRQKRFDFRDPKTLELIESVPVNCDGLNHMDFDSEGKIAVASCEFSGNLVMLDVAKKKILRYLTLPKKNQKTPMPQDVRLSSDGKYFFVADMAMDGIHLIDFITFRETNFIKTGVGTHSLYPSRDGRFFYVGNRGCHKMENCPPNGPGSISVFDPIAKKVIREWKIPGGGSPDMGNINADGSELWISGKYDNVVYVFNTETGKLTHKIPVGREPHGLTVWPQSGRFSLGHTGNMR